MSWVKANTVSKHVDKNRDNNEDVRRGHSSSLLLTMYTDPPDGDISLEEFERFAVDRLHVLRGIEDLKAQNVKGEELDTGIMRLVAQYIKDETKDATIRKDVAGHYILRLAHCRTEELRRTFLSLECELFRARFKNVSAIDQKDFIMENEFPVESLGLKEYEDVCDEVKATVLSITHSVAQANMLTLDSFYKVDFEKVADLVATRRVYVRGGVAYITRDQLGSLVMAPFRSHVSKELAVLSRKWASFCEGPEKDRLAPLVTGLSDRYLGPDYTQNQNLVGEKVTASMLPLLQKESFPLCMSLMMDSLKKNHHLKHTGRQQLGLFLKGIGLPLEEAMRFWRTEMAATAPGDAFDKQYAYNIRHNYGKEGKRADYTPHSCIKIISTIPGPGQVHGCPYRVLSEEELRESLSKKLSLADPNKIEQAVAKAAGGHYQLACATTWEGVHGCACNSGINHPNQYYAESRSQRGDVVAVPSDKETGISSDVKKSQRDASLVDLKTPATKVARMSS